jgi:hypothetical protein
MVCPATADAGHLLPNSQPITGELALAEINKPIEKNRVDPAIETAVAEVAIGKLAFGQMGLTNELPSLRLGGMGSRPLEWA